MASQTTVTGAIAERYATALYDLAEEQKALDQAAQDLATLGAMVEHSSDLQRAIRSPLIGRDDQARAMDALIGKAELSELVRRFIGVIARNRRLFALPGIIKAYHALLAARRGEITAEVTSAVQLNEAQVGTLTEAIKRVVGAKVSVDLKVDPSLIGGLVVRVGSRMIDSSLKTKLQRLQLSMKGIG
ncbi:MAG: F0F1 ATP synthase subunit delta [Alphaproteobacteria bacterium]|nr:F0F1 ATP synthase subunit delta [Alphaproteobacteria bacterium]